MSERPRFWDFYRAIRASKEDDIYLNVHSKETGDVAVYYKTYDMKHTAGRGIVFIMSLMIMIGMLFLPENKLWPNMKIDLNIVIYSLGWLIYILAYKRVYDKAVFEKVPEEEWEDSWEAKRKRRKAGIAVWKYINVILILVAFFNTYCFAYLRYQYEGGAKTNKAEISIEFPENTVRLDRSTPEGVSFYIEQLPENKSVMMDLKLFSIPDEVEIYLNGKNADWYYFDRQLHFFWEDEYFRSTGHGFSDSGNFQEYNTLEIKTKDFSKTWTFELKVKDVG